MRFPLTVMFTAMMLVLSASPFGVPGAAASEREEHHEMTDEDRARRALEKGEVLPLEQLMAGLRDRVQGEISGIELEREKGIWVYEFKVISPRGEMMEVHIDAKTGRLIGKEGK